MSFDRPWVLLLLLLPVIWAAIDWRNSLHRWGSVLKALAFAAILIALSEPQITAPETRTGVAVLIDTSMSIATEDLRRAGEIAERIRQASGRHWTRIIPFAREVRELTPGELENTGQLRQTEGAAGRATDIESGVRHAIGSIPAGLIPRVVLISDGQETLGSVARAAYLARQLGVPVDTYSVPGRPRPKVRVESVSLPSLAFSGERFPIDLVISAPREASGTVELTAEGKVLGSSPVKLEAGTHPIRVYASVNASGAVDISGKIRVPEAGETGFEQAIMLRRPRMLFVSIDPDGTEAQFLDAMKAAQIDVQRASDVPARLTDYQIVVLNNWDLEKIPAARKEVIEEYVRQGGGVLVIGGERNMYVEEKTEDPLDRVLPAKLAPPRSPEGICVVLIVDKSSSMEGRKMELARLAAIGVIENLRPVDQVGVLIFDNSFQWAVPIRRAEDRNMIKRLVAGITPDGGTQIAPAVTEAYRRVLPVDATYKHVVLLTDGISEEGDSIALAKEAGANRVTISTVGLGQDVNRAYLEKVASFARGKSYFLTDPSGLEQILLKDVMEHTGSTAIERPVVPVVLKDSPILRTVGIESAPPLRGYVKYMAKPTAETILSVDRKDPLLVLWQFGLGRSAVFTSDAKSRWAEKWIGWPGFDKFWINLTRDLLPHAQSVESSVSYDTATGKLIAEYRLARHVPEPTVIPEIFAFGPAGFQKPVPVRKVAEGVYRGEVAIADRQGLFRVRPVEESRIFPETGLYREEEELTRYGPDEALLKRVSEFTGGRYQPPYERVFDASGPARWSTIELWPALLCLAIAFSLAELLVRKWSGLVDWFRARRGTTAESRA